MQKEIRKHLRSFIGGRQKMHRFIDPIKNRTSCILTLCVLTASSLALPALQAQSTQLSFSPEAGKTAVDVTINGVPTEFKQGAVYCQVGDLTGPAKLLDSSTKSTISVVCPRKLKAGDSVTVSLTRDGMLLAPPVNKVVLPGSRSVGKTRQAQKLRFMSVSPDGPRAVKIAGAGTADANQIAVYDSSAHKISTGTATSNPDGTFTVPVSNSVKDGDEVTVMIGDAPLKIKVGADKSNKIGVAFSPDPKDTQTSITGYLSGDTAALARVQAVYLEVVNGVDSHGDVVQGPLDGKYNSSTYGFSATNLKALAEGQSVHVHVCGAPVTVIGDTTKGSSTIKNISSTQVLVVGQGISGDTIPTGAAIVSKDSNQITISENASDAKTGVTLTLSGQSCAQAGPQNGAGGKGGKDALVEIVPVNPEIEVISLYDLGRIKAYFSIGAEFEGKNGSLGTTTGFLAADIDENWLTTGPPKKPPCFASGDSHDFKRNARLQASHDGVDDDCGSTPFRFMVNTYTKAELTDIPLTTSTMNSSGTQQTAIALRPAAATTGGGSGGSGGSSTSSFDISKAKGAYVEGGIYTPLLLPAMQWTFRGQSNAFFFAPLGKYIFLDPDTTPNGATTSFNVYRAYAGGFRLGHFRLPSNFSKQNPELLSYVDVTWGRWENFREANGNRGARLDVNGRYKIPYTILYIGFEANTGPGGSDYRLFAGTRVDISSILGKLLPSSN